MVLDCNHKVIQKNLDTISVFIGMRYGKNIINCFSASLNNTLLWCNLYTRWHLLLFFYENIISLPDTTLICIS